MAILHDLHPAWSQVPDQGGGININAEVVKHGLGDLIHLFLVHQGAKLLAVADVLCCGQHVDEVELLVDTLDAMLTGQSGGHGLIGLAVYRDGAAVRGMGAGDGLDEGGLARAILTDQGVDLAGVEVDGHLVQGDHAGKDLHDVPEGQDGFFLFQIKRLPWPELVPEGQIQILRTHGAGRREGLPAPARKLCGDSRLLRKISGGLVLSGRVLLTHGPRSGETVHGNGGDGVIVGAAVAANIGVVPGVAQAAGGQQAVSQVLAGLSGGP